MPTRRDQSRTRGLFAGLGAAVICLAPAVGYASPPSDSLREAASSGEPGTEAEKPAASGDASAASSSGGVARAEGPSSPKKSNKKGATTRKPYVPPPGTGPGCDGRQKRGKGKKASLSGDASGGGNSKGSANEADAAGADSAGNGAQQPDKLPWIRRCAPQRNLVEIGLYTGLHMAPVDHDLYDPSTRPVKALWATSLGVYGLRVAYFPLRFLGVELEGELTPTLTRTANDDFALVWGARAHAILQLPNYRITPFLLGGAGMLGVSSNNLVLGKDVDPAAHLGLGVKYYATERVALRLEGRSILSARAAEQDQTNAHWQALLGVSFVLGRKAPPPPPPPDSDDDGFIDREDKCPTVPGVAPDGCPPPDRDEDGFIDEKDACPDEAGVAPDGCPIKDTDGDGIMDPDDKCVTEPETDNNYQDEDGCPDEVPQEVKEFSGVIDGIAFAFGSADISSSSKPILDKAIGVLKQYPKIRLEISGHTDDVGTRETNIDLSARRAQAVKDYLVAGGIEADRLETRGAGPDEPLGDNATDEGRAKNRRTEFKLLK